MNYRQIFRELYYDGAIIVFNTSKLKVTDWCDTCRTVWAKDSFHTYVFKTGKNHELELVKKNELK